MICNPPSSSADAKPNDAPQTEEDFAEMAGAGLNWVRLPIPFWAIETWGNEPFMARTCWQYILKALLWARKYGLRVNIDLHTIPGSQNGEPLFRIESHRNRETPPPETKRPHCYAFLVTDFPSPSLLGYNHSGKSGDPNVLNGVMGIANAQRALNYIRIFAEFFSQPEYTNLIGIFGIMNEPLQSTIGKDSLTSLYVLIDYRD